MPTTPIPTGGVDGTTPVNAANIQVKNVSDNRSGHLVFSNCGPFLSNFLGGVAVPLRVQRKSQSGSKVWDIWQETVQFPAMFWNEASSITFNPIYTNGNFLTVDVFRFSGAGQSATNAYNSKLACWVQFTPKGTACDELIWEGQVVAWGM